MKNLLVPAFGGHGGNKHLHSGSVEANSDIVFSLILSFHVSLKILYYKNSSYLACHQLLCKCDIVLSSKHVNGTQQL